MSSETEILIQQLHRVEKLLGDLKKEDSLTPDDWKIYTVAEKYFGEKYFFENNYSHFLKNLPISAVSDFILELQKEEGNEDQEEIEDRKETKPKEQEVSIPPELESLVAEYQQNQALLNDKEIKSNSQRSVAEQVKIAIAHSKIKELAHTNKQRRLEKGEKFQDADKALISLGSPKSESFYDALDTSYQAIQEVASTYKGFSKLSEQLQNEIISNAVELNIIGISDLDTAIQASVLQVESSSLSDTDKTNLATIPGGFVSIVYQEIKTQDQKTFVYQTTLNENEQKLIQLEDKLLTKSEAEKAATSLEIKVITAENEKISLALEEQEKYLSETIEKQTESFKAFTADREKRISQDPDLVDKIELANKNIASIHSNLKANGIEAKLYSPMDDVKELEAAIRHDLPGELRPNSGNEAEKAAALIKNPRTKSKDISPQAILLYGKDLTPKLLAKARKFAKENPNSELGKLLKNRKDLFDSASSQLRKISGSVLGKQITRVSTGIGKVFNSISKNVSKFTDRIPGGIGSVFRIIQDPLGAFKSWAGKKAGEYVLRQFSKRIANETLKKTGELLLKNGVSTSIKKLAGQAAAKLALKLGIQAAASSTGVGVIVAVAIEVLSWIWDKTVSAVNKLAVSVYGEKIKVRDLLAVPAMGIAGVATFIAGIGTATATAASSAAVTIGLGALVGFIFYITSIAVAPLISTLVQLESISPTGNYGDLSFDCGPDAGAEIMVDAGQYPVMLNLLKGPGRTGLCITPTKITIHWSGGWSSNDITYQVLEQRGLSCQIGTDQDGSVQQWQQMWENKAELAWCTGGNENNYCLNNEMVGAYFIPPGATPTGPNDREPSEDEIQSAVNTTCFMMKQYNIPSSQIFGHYQLMPGKIDPGEEFLAYFINRVENECP